MNVSLTGVHMHSNGSRHYNSPDCKRSPLTHGTFTRCRCGNYPQTTIQGDCTMCGAGYYESDSEWRYEIRAGFVETEETEETFPITVMVYLNTHGKDNAGEYVKISNVRESSITIEERKGIRTLVCESFVTSRIAYVPYAVWYMTEVQTRVMDY